MELNSAIQQTNGRARPRVLFTPPHTGFHATGGLSRIGGGLPLGCPTTITGLRENIDPTSPNSGNLFHVEAPAKTFDCDRSGSCFGHLPQLSNDYDVEIACKEIEAGYDALVVSFDNIIRNWNPDKDLDTTKGKFDRVSTFVENLRIPVYVLGIGVQHYPDPNSIWAPLLRLLRAVNDKAALFGVRGEGTRDWLHGIGLTNAKAIGCPSMFAFARNVLSAEPITIVADAPVGTAGHFGGTQNERKRASMEMLRRVSTETRAAYVFQNDLFSLCRRDDHPEAYEEATGLLNKAFIDEQVRRLAGSQVSFREYYYFRDAPRWRVFAHHQALYLGDRFHGGVAYWQAGRPALIAGADERVKEMTSYFDLPFIHVNEAATQPVSVSIEKYLNAGAIRRMRETYVRRLADYVRVCEEAGLEFSSRDMIERLLQQHA